MHIKYYEEYNNRTTQRHLRVKRYKKHHWGLQRIWGENTFVRFFVYLSFEFYKDQHYLIYLCLNTFHTGFDVLFAYFYQMNWLEKSTRLCFMEKWGEDCWKIKQRLWYWLLLNSFCTSFDDLHSLQGLRNDFVRNIMWTFEDIHMLVGSNMPIFGGGRYPAVSLKLRFQSSSS